VSAAEAGEEGDQGRSDNVQGRDRCERGRRRQASRNGQPHEAKRRRRRTDPRRAAGQERRLEPRATAPVTAGRDQEIAMRDAAFLAAVGVSRCITV
jgi:hypothetical protein